MLTVFISFFLGQASCTYEERYAQAIRERSAYVVFVGVPACYVPGAIVHEEPRGLSWHRGPGVIVSVNRGTWLEWVDTLPPTAGRDEIREAIRRARLPAAPPYVAPPTIAPVAPFMPAYRPAMRFGGGGGNC